MSLVYYEVGYHLTDKPKNFHRIHLYTGEDPASVDKYLIRKYGAGRVVLRYADREHICGYCGCTRSGSENVPRPLHPALFDETQWRQL